MWFRNFIVPFALAAVFILCVEGSIAAFFHPSFWQKTSWLLYDPFRQERTERLAVYEKLFRLADSKPDIISLGDSAGLHCIQPSIVNRYLPGLKYVNMNTIAQHTMEGHLAIAEYTLRRNASLKYILLYLYPSLVPTPWLSHQAEGGRMLRRYLEGLNAWFTPPSASFAPYVKKAFFEMKVFRPQELLSDFAPYREFHYALDDTLGWMPEHDARFDHINGKVEFHPDIEKSVMTFGGLGQPSALLSGLNDAANLAQKHKVTLLIAFAPVPSTAVDYQDANLRHANRLLEQFQAQRPEVKFITPYITPWDISKFSEYNHIAREYSHEASERLGRALARAVAKPDSIKPFAAVERTYDFPKITDVKPERPATKAEKAAALAYYAYTVTGWEEHRSLLSQRVQGLLAESRSFHYAMKDTWRRERLLKEKGVSLIYDDATITAEKVYLRGGTYCGNSDKISWIHLKGHMNLGVAKPELTTKMAISWDKGNIIIPIIYENGAPRFDGYCPARVMDRS